MGSRVQCEMSLRRLSPQLEAADGSGASVSPGVTAPKVLPLQQVQGLGWNSCPGGAFEGGHQGGWSHSSAEPVPGIR